MKNLLFFFSIIITGVLSSCSTEVELNAPYNSQTVIFGLLDPATDTQFVKINRTFLGDGNNLDYAMIADSLEYENLQGRIEKLDGNGNTLESYPLQEILKHDKTADGIFYAPTYKSYYITDQLDPHFTYKIITNPNENDEVSATTNLIEPKESGTIFSNLFADIKNNPDFNLATVQGGVVKFFTKKIAWLRTENAYRYELVMRFHYRENIWDDLAHTNLASSTLQHLDYSFGVQEAKTTSASESFEVSYNTEDFFSYLQNNLVADAYVSRTVAKKNVNNADNPRFFDFYLTAANDELNTYITINSPVTGIVQEKPEYSNVNNGLGLFASKTDFNIFGKTAKKEMVQALTLDSRTSDLNFCTDHLVWKSQTYYCGE